jgi:hypothetical protein
MKSSTVARKIGRRVAALGCAAWLTACSSVANEPALVPAAAVVARTPVAAVQGGAPDTPRPLPCPAGLPDATRCLAGRDSAGAPYLIAMPSVWNGVLVLHAHGGPSLGEPRLERSVDDLKRWAIIVKAGYAWAGSTFHQGGVAVRSAAEDTERLRGIFLQHVARPRLTILHGQSWGASVAAKGAEMFTRTSEGKPPYDAVLLTSGVLGGGTHSYDFRLDLRVVYQYLCHNHPRPDEPPYPLWMGLPPGSTLTEDQLAGRVRECLGTEMPAAQRTTEQARRLKTVVEVIRIPESSVLGHLAWATFGFRDISEKRTGGANIFGNMGAVYRGSDNDEALNAGVLRYAADADAVRRFGEDTDPNGRIPVPVLTVHAANDPTAAVELEARFRQTMTHAGTADHLVQVYTGHAAHSYLADPIYPTLLEALLSWVAEGRKPTPAGLAERCEALRSNWPGDCSMRPDFQPQALDTRFVARQRP